MVQVGGTDILGTPLTVEVMPRKPGKSFPDLSNPAGVAITKGHLFVAESDSSCVTIFNIASEQKLRSYGQLGAGQMDFKDPQGMTVTQDGCIIITDFSNHRLQVLALNGSFQATVGSDGSQFKSPIDAAVHHNGKIFVTEYSNHHVQVLNADSATDTALVVYSTRTSTTTVQMLAIDAYGLRSVSRNNRIQSSPPRVSCWLSNTNKGEGQID